MSSPPLCICISGQMRQFKPSMDAIGRLASATDAQVIISTWRKRGRKRLSGALGADQFPRIFPPFFLNALAGTQFQENIFSLSPILVDFVESYLADEVVSFDEIRQIFPFALIDIEDEEQITSNLALHLAGSTRNQFYMLYKIWRCNAMKRELEEARGQRFGGVLRIRPDLLAEGLDLTVLDENSIYSDWVDTTNGHLGDTILFSSSAVMDIYSNLYEKFQNSLLRSLSSGSEFRWDPHRYSYDHMRQHDIDIRKLRGTRFSLLPDFVDETALVSVTERMRMDAIRVGRQEVVSFCHCVLGELALSNGQTKPALAEAEAAISVWSQNPSAHWLRSRALDRVGDRSGAICAAFEAVYLSESRLAGHDHLDTPSAIRDHLWELVVRRAPSPEDAYSQLLANSTTSLNSPSVIFLIINFLIESGRRDIAIDRIEEALLLWPASSAFRRFKQALA